MNVPMGMNKEGIDFEGQPLAGRLAGEADGAGYGLEPTPAETVTTASEEGSDLRG